jgi:hypothetical protein
LTSPVQVEYPDAEPNGLAEMLGGLIQANLEQHPERATLLKQAVIAITAPDAEVSVTIMLQPSKVIVRNGRPPIRPQLDVTTDSITLIELSSVPLRFGLPDSMTKEGREVTKKLLSGSLKVRGLLTHAGTLARFNKLLSVA